MERRVEGGASWSVPCRGLYWAARRWAKVSTQMYSEAVNVFFSSLCKLRDVVLKMSM